MRRRELLQAGAGLALAGGLGACGISRGISGDTTRQIEPKVDGDLLYFNYSEYINPKLIDGFKEKYDVEVIESYFDSMPGMVAKLQAGNAYDVFYPTAEYVERLITSKSLLEIPIERLKNFENIYSYFHDPWYDPGSKHTVPYSLYLTGIGYNAAQVDNMTGSWNDFSNEQAAGRIFVLDDYQEAIGAANLRNGFDLNTVNEEQLNQSKDWLVDLKPNLRGFSVDIITNMTSGNGWIQHMWNGDVINIRRRVEDPENYRFQKCKEGDPVGNDTMAIPVNSEHPGTALLFMDWMMDPKHAAMNVGWNGYPMPNTGADATFEKMAEGDPQIVVGTEDLTRKDQYANLPEEDRQLWDRTWTEVKVS